MALVSLPFTSLVYDYKAEFHDTDIDTDILARILARMSVSVSWNAAYSGLLSL